MSDCNRHGDYDATATDSRCPQCQHVDSPTPFIQALVKVGERDRKVADDLQRRRYAEAALNGYCASYSGPDCASPEPNATARRVFDYADAMLLEQQRREGAQ